MVSQLAVVVRVCTHACGLNMHFQCHAQGISEAEIPWAWHGKCMFAGCAGPCLPNSACIASLLDMCTALGGGPLGQVSLAALLPCQALSCMHGWEWWCPSISRGSAGCVPRVFNLEDYTT